MERNALLLKVLRHSFKTFLVISFTVTLLSNDIPEAKAARWIFPDGWIWTIGQVCHDGAELFVANPNSADNPDSHGATWTYASPHIYTSEQQPTEMPSNYDGYVIDISYGLNNAYYKLAHHETVQGEYQTIINEDGEEVPNPLTTEFQGRVVDLYIWGRGIISWSQHLPTNTAIYFDSEVAESRITMIDFVEACYFNKIFLKGGDSVIVDNESININHFSIDSEVTKYEVDTIFKGVQIFLNGLKLSVGDFFTQKDIDEGRLSVEGGEFNIDSFIEYTSRTTIGVSINSNGAMGNGRSRNPSISNFDEWNDDSFDGGLNITFQSTATNLIDNDTNGNVEDVFVRTMLNEEGRLVSETNIVSINSNGIQGSTLSRQPKVSANGEYISFESESNLISGTEPCNISEDDNGEKDIYVRDQGQDKTQIFSLTENCALFNNSSSRFASRPAINFDYRQEYVAYANGNQIYVTNEDGITNLISKSSDNALGNGQSAFPSISLFGMEVVFHSQATNLFSGGDPNGSITDIFRGFSDSTQGNLLLVSNDYSGNESNGKSQRPTNSIYGRYIAFRSEASDLLPANMDTNGTGDIFVYDREDDKMVRVSVWSNGSQMNGTSTIPEMSTNGRFIAFRYAPPDKDHLSCGSAGGGYQIYVHDRDADNNNVFDEPGGIRTYAVSVSNRNELGNKDSCSLSISPDGSYVAFSSYSTNLVEENTNGVEQVYVHHQFTGKLPISVEFDGPVGGGDWSLFLPFAGKP